MSLYAIDGFDDGPHWESAFVEADTPEGAARILAALIEKDDVGGGTVWNVQPLDKWRIKLADRPFLFILGSGCR